MANNIPDSGRERSRRLPQKKKYDDYIVETNNRLPCQGCENVFKSRKILLQHQATCLTLKVVLSKQQVGSFLEASKPNQKKTQQQDDSEKILPLSQPLEPYDHRNNPGLICCSSSCKETANWSTNAAHAF